MRPRRGVYLNPARYLQTVLPIGSKHSCTDVVNANYLNILKVKLS